jgi:hypothetical protein
MSDMNPLTTRRLERTKYLWEEYKYRHDLIWQRTFTFTTAIVLISIIPYLQEDVARLLEEWIIIAPILAVVLAGFGLLVMLNELYIFSKIKNKYRRQQNLIFIGLHDIDKQDHDNKDRFKWFTQSRFVKWLTQSKFNWFTQSRFNKFVTAYFVSLLVLSIFNVCIVAWVWIPRLLKLPTCPCP